MPDMTILFGADAEGTTPEAAALASPRKFVRSKSEIAQYEEEREPSGHVLTAWETLTAYGVDVLEEVAELRKRDSHIEARCCCGRPEVAT